MEANLILISVLLFGTMLIAIAAGLSIAFTLSGAAILFTLFLWGPNELMAIPSFLFSEGSSWELLAVPLFVLMANFLEVSGMAEELYTMFNKWIGSIPGGLASGTVIGCAIFAAMAGISGVATITMGLIAVPSMLKHGYDKQLAVGTVMAGGALGILIPPSVIAVIYGTVTGVSVGGLFAGGVLPGILLTTIFLVYITGRCIIQPSIAPRMVDKFSWSEKLISLRGVILPAVLIFVVLGSIYSGICTPTEAAGVGAMGALIITVARRQLTWKFFRLAITRTMTLTTMVVWIVFGAACFTSVYTKIGASELILKAVLDSSLQPMVVIGVMMMIYFFMGMFLDPAGMCMLTVPVFVPIVKALGFDPLWFGILFIVNSEMAYITPPFGFNLFYMRSIVPPSVTTGDIYRSVIPFVVCQAICLVIVMFVPELVLWLPSKLINAPIG